MGRSECIQEMLQRFWPLPRRHMHPADPGAPLTLQPRGRGWKGTSDDGAKGAEEGLLHGGLHPLAEDHHRREQHVQRAPPPQLHADAVVAARGPAAGNEQPAATSTILSFLPGLSLMQPCSASLRGASYGSLLIVQTNE